MAVPRRKTSPSRRGMRRSADALKKPTYAEDKDSGELRSPPATVLPHSLAEFGQPLRSTACPASSRQDSFLAFRTWRPLYMPVFRST